jgi:hypothetical protein
LWSHAVAGNGRRSLLRGRKRILLAASVTVVLLGWVALQFAAPSCDSGRTCIRDAGISVVLRQGWSTRQADGGELLVAAPGKDASVEMVIEKPAGLIDAGVPATLDEVERAVIASVTAESPSGTPPVADRLALPIGPAVRLRYTSSSCFFMCSNESTTSIWFVVNGQPIAVEYLEAFGEGTATLPSAVDAADLQSLLDSIRLSGRATTAQVAGLHPGPGRSA